MVKKIEKKIRLYDGSEAIGVKYPNSKYNNTIVYYDDMKFDSIGEANRYVYLKHLENDGVIRDLKCQVKFKICESVKYKEERRDPIRYYIADFQYLTGKPLVTVVEDFKSESTAKGSTYRLKRQLFLSKYYGIVDFKEVYDYMEPVCQN